MRIAVARRNAQCSDLNTAASSGYIRFYDGARPAGPDSALTAGNNAAAALRFAVTAGTWTAGVWTANAITSDTNAAGAPTNITFGRLFQSDGTTPICDVSAGTSGASAEATLASATIAAGNSVSCSSCVITAPLGT